MKLAPTILFVFNRPEHTLKTLESLKNNLLSSETTLYVFADGPKEDSSISELKQIDETRKILKKEKWCGNVIITENTTNKGLSKSIIEGVTFVLNIHDKAIILEDDLITSPYFLQFMNDALYVYQNNNNVACISGYVYPTTKKLPTTFFIKGADCWGWATWKDKWDIFEPDGKKLMNQLVLENKTFDFDFNGSYNYTQMLADQIDGKNNSWAIRWYASAFLANKYCLYPGVSLVQNIGIDGSGTHSGISNQWEVIISNQRILVEPLETTESKKAKQQFIMYFNNLRNPKKNISQRIKSIIHHFLKNK